jgi:sec-independent protein translocase protein TatA
MLLFLNISGGEIAVIFLIVLLLFGPQSIPTIARTLGRGIRAIKDASSEIQSEIRKSADKLEKDSPIKREDLDLTKELRDDESFRDPTV